jgi:hypothetical protein
VTIDPQVAAILAAFVVAILMGVPGVHRALRQRRRAAQKCLFCARTVVLGERTCDCTDEPR